MASFEGRYLALRADIMEKEFFFQQQDAVVHAPQNKIPGGTVPEAGEGPDNKDISDVLCRGGPAAA